LSQAAAESLRDHPSRSALKDKSRWPSTQPGYLLFIEQIEGGYTGLNALVLAPVKELAAWAGE
jgi:hypothetical protein